MIGLEVVLRCMPLDRKTPILSQNICLSLTRIAQTIRKQTKKQNQKEQILTYHVKDMKNLFRNFFIPTKNNIWVACLLFSWNVLCAGSAWAKPWLPRHRRVWGLHVKGQKTVTHHAMAIRKKTFRRETLAFQKQKNLSRSYVKFPGRMMEAVFDENHKQSVSQWVSILSKVGYGCFQK